MKKLKSRISEHKYNNEFSNKILMAEGIFNEIYSICGHTMEYGCGSYLIGPDKYEYSIDMYPKQKLLYDKAKEANNILEVGTYMGHSLLIMLIANPNINITTIDIEDKYSKPAVDYLKTQFQNANIKFIKGNSLDVLPRLYEKYDLFHVDGSHRNTVITEEFRYCKKLIHNNNFKIIFDDLDTCLTLNKNISTAYQIEDSQTPDCIYRNHFINIKINSDSKIDKHENKKFSLVCNLSFIKEFPFRVIKYLLRKFTSLINIFK